METLQRVANRGSISTGGYEIDNSVKLEDDNDEYLTRTNASGTNRKTFTVSAWFKQTALATQLGHITEIWDGGTNGNATRMGVYSDDRLWVDVAGGTGNTGTQFRSLATLKLRDTSAWYHMVLAVDTTQSTEANRMKVWLNGTEVTAWDQHQIPTEDYECSLESGTTMSWGSYNSTYHGFSGYLAECNYLDGVTATQNDFGEYDDDTGIWIPKEYTGSYAGQSAYLDFSDASDLGANSKGDDVNFSLVNIAAADQSTDTPTNNFCTLNPLWVYANALTTGPIEGATEVADGAWAGTKATMGVANGKWYWEFKASGADSIVGIQTDEGVALTGNAHNILSTCALNLNGEVWIKDSTSGRNDTDVTQTFSSSDIYGIALNMDDNQISFYQAGSLITDGGSIALDGLADKTVFPFASNYNTTIEFNFGGYTTISISSAAADANDYGTFEYAPPTGYYALCTKNLSEFGG